MKKWVPAIAVIGLAGALFYIFSQSRAPSPAPGTATDGGVAASGGQEQKTPGASNSNAHSKSNASHSVSSPASSAPVAAAAPIVSQPDQTATNSVSGELTNLPPAAVLDNMRLTINHYASMFGGNPVGTNPEITAALNGNNPKGANFIKPEAGMRINEQGELIDPWGTPYFFHALSGTSMEIHSAGPDRVMWTADDLVVK